MAEAESQGKEIENVGVGIRGKRNGIQLAKL